MSITLSDQHGKTHRTALFIEGDKLEDSVFKERAGRLIDSLNGSNIKVDLFVVRGSVASRIRDRSDLSTPNGVAFDATAAIAAGSEAGYDQVLVSASGRG